MENSLVLLRALLVISSAAWGIMLIAWLVYLSGIKKCVVVFSDNEALKKSINSKNIQSFDNVLIEYGIQPKNQLAKLIYTIHIVGMNKENLDLDALLDKLKFNFDRQKEYVIKLAILVFIVSGFLSIYMGEAGFVWLFCSVAGLIISNIIAKFYADNLFEVVCSNAIEIYKPNFYHTDKVRFDEKMALLKNVLSAVEDEKANIQKATEHAKCSDESAKSSLESLELISGILKDLYEFEVSNSKVTPKDAVIMLDESIKNIDSTFKETHSLYQENMNIYKSVFSKISNIGEIQTSIKDLSLQTIESLKEFTKNHTGIAISIDTSLSEKLNELVTDTKFSFMNLNEMSNKIYEQMDEVFKKNVETSNALCQSTESHYIQLNSNIDSFCKSINKKLDNTSKANEQIETGIIALCSANYKLLELLTDNSIVNPNNSAKEFAKDQGKDGKSLREHFENMALDLKLARENVDKLISLTEKGGGDK